MKQFEARFIADKGFSLTLDQLSDKIDSCETQYIDNLLWSNDDDKPVVSFKMAYNDDSILLKYSVAEKYWKATYKQINDPVYKDSCVELFIAFDNDDHYYNLEFNGLGTALVGYGTGKNDRSALDKRLIENIQSEVVTHTSCNNKDMPVEWELMLKIPFSIFEHHHITSLKNQTCRVNFFKCGDDLPKPHFLSWNNINHPTPNFHLSQFFGEVKFVL